MTSIEGVSPRLRTLIVDDDHDTADTMGRLVEIGGDDVRICYDGESALSVALAFEPEVGLIDLQIPRLDGFRLAKHLRDLPQLHDMLLVAVTGFADRAHRTLAKDAGFDEYLVKPFSLLHLRDILRIARATRSANGQIRADSVQLYDEAASQVAASSAAVCEAHEVQHCSSDLVRRRRQAELSDCLATVQWQPLVSLLAAHADCHWLNQGADCWCPACVRRSIHSVLAGESVSDIVVLRLLNGLHRHVRPK